MADYEKMELYKDIGDLHNLEGSNVHALHTT